ncbi:hypothetical protein [Roseateles terrae]|uniref:DUF4132 domain-containing protein n=1 Tax=Roseateles terrae TaxID=431060 RepID=A0ABR6GY64_9BURK|nr:hypothetical protein [Roseateles terrae]MBB3197051.1 hypothetical protein [Roseateles terrae]OWQ84216.1 hypothetical protein CDN98_19730 [Roseateles terrae]
MHAWHQAPGREQLKGMFPPTRSPSDTFSRSVPAFLDAAPDLYPARAFDIPANPVPAPPARADWLSYDGPTEVQSPEYRAFRTSPAFLQVHRQMLDRVDDIETFARRHASPVEFRQWMAGLNVFRLRLVDHGESFVGDRMALLYGPGKRALDHICQRLLQDELPLDFRCRQLREMCHQLKLCMATGPAFLQTAQALNVDPNGLRSALLEVIQTHADEVFRRAYRKEHADDYWVVRDNWEVHGINRMRLEYGLPGGDLSDIHSFRNDLFLPHRQRNHHKKLRLALDPCRMAEVLADRYLAELSSRLPACVPQRCARVDLNPFFPAVMEAVGAANGALAPVSPLSLMEEDETTGECYWRQDPSLVQRDVLLSLEAQELVTPRARVELASNKADNHGWTLEAVDGQLFYVMVTSGLQPAPQAIPVGVEHLLSLERKQRSRAWPLGPGVGPSLGPGAGGSEGTPPVLLPERLITTVLQSTSPQDLGRVPARWLTGPAHLQTWLQRIGPLAFESWLRAHPPERLPASITLPTLVLAVTGAKRGDLLRALLNRVPGAPRDPRLMELATDAMAWGAPTADEILDVWQQYLCGALPTLSQDAVESLFCDPERAMPLALAVVANDGQHLRRLLALLTMALTHKLIPPDTLRHVLDDSLPLSMRQGHVQALNALSEFLVDAAARDLIHPDELARFLGGRQPRLPCEEATRNGHAGCVHGYFDLISQLHARGVLSSASLGPLVAAPSPQNAVVSYGAVANQHPEALRAYLARLTQSAAQGQLDPTLLKRQLTCDGLNQSGVQTLLRQTDPACLHVWRESVREAQRSGLISSGDVRDLIAVHSFSRVALLPHLLRQPANHGGLQAWTETAIWLVQEGVLTHPDILALLRGDDRDMPGVPPLMNDLMRAHRDPAMVKAYLDLVGQMTYRGVLHPHEAESLLSAPEPTSDTPALIDAVRHQSRPVIDAFFRGLMYRGWARTLSPDALTRLMDGRSRLGRSALTTAIRHNDAEMLHLLLNNAFQFLRQRLIGKAQWLSLFEPGPAAPAHLPIDGALDAVERLNPEPLTPLLAEAVKEAWAARLIEDHDAQQLLYRLTVGAAEAAARRALTRPPKSLTP